MQEKNICRPPPTRQQERIRSRQSRTRVLDTYGADARKAFWWMGPYWIRDAENGTFELGTLASKILPKEVNGFRLKPYKGSTAPNPFSKPLGE